MKMGLVSTKPIGREDQIRTGDPLHPIQVRYRAAPLPEQRKVNKKDYFCLIIGL